MNKLMIVAVACLIGGGAPALADPLHDFLGAVADTKLAVSQCPGFELNQNEFVLWAAKERFPPEEMESPKMQVFMVLVANFRIEAQKKAGQTAGEKCDSWWRLYGTDGAEHPNLLLKR
jgi:hypothetical protein